MYLAQAVDDHDRRRGPPQRSTGLIEEELMDRKNPEPLWTPTQVATYLGVPVQTLYQWQRWSARNTSGSVWLRSASAPPPAVP